MAYELLSIIRENSVGDDVGDKPVLEKDIGELSRRDLCSKYCPCERTMHIGNDEYKLASGASPWDRSKIINGYKL